MRTIVCVPCHFARKDVLCDTTLRRLEEALHLSNSAEDIEFIVTGNVPYEKGSKTLSNLQRQYLVDHGVPTEKIYTGEGVGTFSEARTVTSDAWRRHGPEHQMIVVSSDWYFWAGAMIWRKFAREYHLSLTLHRVKYTGGIKTKMIYFALACVIGIFFAVRKESVIEEKLTQMQMKRKEGFTMDGCG